MKIFSKLTLMLIIASLSLASCTDEKPADNDTSETSETTLATVENTVEPVISNGGNLTNGSESFSATFEAEDGIMAGNIKTGANRAGFSGTGYATNFNKKSDNKWSVSTDIPHSQFYDITVCAASDDYKENILQANGNTVGTIGTQKGGNFSEIVFEGIYLEKGATEFAIQESWGYLDLDYIKIENGESISNEYYNGISSELVNENANNKTQRIMNFIIENYGKNVISGQYTDHGTSNEVDAINKLTGKYPALRGFDFIFSSPTCSHQSDTEKDLAVDWSNRGGLVTFSWHWHAPMENASFYSEKTNFNLSNAVTDKDIATLPLDEIKTMFENGEITEETYRTVSDIDVISSKLKFLEENNVTVLWRPLHEAAGGWFWWGNAGADSYKWLWNLMYERQTEFHELNNLIWVWNGQSKEWYPGDETVDIVGFDIYAKELDSSSQTAKFVETAGFSNSKKVVALTENGVIPDIDLLIRDNTYWSFFNTWCREFIVDSVLGKNVVFTHTSEEVIKEMFTHENVITLDELPDFN